jgi:hypothetical protein
MSMSRACITVEWKKGQHYCITANDEYDYDFRNFTVTGPAKTAEEAFDMHNGCNPGSVSHLSKNGKKLSEAYESWVIRTIKKYKKYKKNYLSSRRRRYYY